MYFNFFVIVFMLLVITWDLRFRRIPNAITVTGLFFGLLYHSFEHTLTSALLGASVGFVFGFILFYMAAVGAGDLKLVTALGAILGFEQWLYAMIATLIVAALIGLFQAISKGRLVATFRNIGLIVVHWSRFGFAPHPELNVRNEAMIRSPFGLAAGIGVLLAVLR